MDKKQTKKNLQIQKSRMFMNVKNQIKMTYIKTSSDEILMIVAFWFQ